MLSNHKKQQTMEKVLLLFDKTISIITPINHSLLFNMNERPFSPTTQQRKKKKNYTFRKYVSIDLQSLYHSGITGLHITHQ